MKQKTNVLHIVTELIVLFAAIGILLNPVKADDYRRFATDTLHYFRASVLKVEKENLTDRKSQLQTTSQKHTMFC